MAHTETPKDIVINIQGLVGPDEIFVPKELAILSVESEHLGHWIFAPPCGLNDIPFAAKRQNRWLTANFHRLDWEDGTTPFKSIHKILKEAAKNVSTIYVRGRETVKFLESVVCRTIVNLDIYSPPFKRLPENKRYCLFHAEAVSHGNFSCALHNAAKLKKWVRENIYTDKVEIDIAKVWNTDAYRIDQITAHEITSDEEDTEEEEEPSNNNRKIEKLIPPPIKPRRVSPGRDVCGIHNDIQRVGEKVTLIL
uniref:Uncharacterized protein n=1 Tax=Bracon brevicornis TaxID=1563983 RepID=A0A6V7LC85_9HYME